MNLALKAGLASPSFPLNSEVVKVIRNIHSDFVNSSTSPTATKRKRRRTKSTSSSTLSSTTPSPITIAPETPRKDWIPYALKKGGWREENRKGKGRCQEKTKDAENHGRRLLSLNPFSTVSPSSSLWPSAPSTCFPLWLESRNHSTRIVGRRWKQNHYLSVNGLPFSLGHDLIDFICFAFIICCLIAAVHSLPAPLPFPPIPLPLLLRLLALLRSPLMLLPMLLKSVFVLVTMDGWWAGDQDKHKENCLLSWMISSSLILLLSQVGTTRKRMIQKVLEFSIDAPLLLLSFPFLVLHRFALFPHHFSFLCFAICVQALFLFLARVAPLSFFPSCFRFVFSFLPFRSGWPFVTNSFHDLPSTTTITSWYLTAAMTIFVNPEHSLLWHFDSHSKAIATTVCDLRLDQRLVCVSHSTSNASVEGCR